MLKLDSSELLCQLSTSSRPVSTEVQAQQGRLLLILECQLLDIMKQTSTSPGIAVLYCDCNKLE